MAVAVKFLFHRRSQSIFNSTHLKRLFSAAPSTHPRIAGRRRFYKNVSVGELDVGENVAYTINLDHRQLKTPAKAPLHLPSKSLAYIIAAEWDAQGTDPSGNGSIDPTSMPMMSLAATALDQIAIDRVTCVDNIMKYFHNDTLCYLAPLHERIVRERQEHNYLPLVHWMEEVVNAADICENGAVKIDINAATASIKGDGRANIAVLGEGMSGDGGGGGAAAGGAILELFRRLPHSEHSATVFEQMLLRGIDFSYTDATDGSATATATASGAAGSASPTPFRRVCVGSDWDWYLAAIQSLAMETKSLLLPMAVLTHSPVLINPGTSNSNSPNTTVTATASTSPTANSNHAGASASPGLLHHLSLVEDHVHEDGRRHIEQNQDGSGICDVSSMSVGERLLQVARIEEEFNIEVWGMVEGGHDVQYNNAVVKAATATTLINLLSKP